MKQKQYTKIDPNINLKDVSPTKPAFGYYGAKQRISSSIIKMLPPHNAWVEVFCGSAAITLAKIPVQIEVINDLDSNIVNLFRQLRENKIKLIDAIQLTPYSRKEFINSRIIKIDDSDLERARKFLINSMMTVNSVVGSNSSGFSYSMSYSRNNMEARVSRWANLPERIEKAVNRLRTIRIENKDAREIVKLFSNRPATLMYLDPPYFIKRKHGYCIDARDKEFHEELLELCCRSRAMMIVSNYDNKLYRDYLNRNTGWVRKIIKTTTRDTTGKDFERKEILWMNQSFVKAKKTNKVPIRLSAKERKNKKINPSRK